MPTAVAWSALASKGLHSRVYSRKELAGTCFTKGDVKCGTLQEPSVTHSTGMWGPGGFSTPSPPSECICC